jgi:hypothetical protein
MSDTIYFNGKKYNGVAEMPSSVRQNYEKFNQLLLDENQDGIPDLMQSGGLSGLKDTFGLIKEFAQMNSTEGFEQGQFSIIRETERGIFVNGKWYTRVDKMPNHVRQAYEQATQTAKDGRSDIYDETWREVNRDEFFEPHDDEVLNPTILRQSSYNTNPIETVDSNSRFIMLAALAILIIGALAAVWFIFS